MKKSLLIVGMLMVFLIADAQVQTPSASPSGSVSTTVGLTEIKVEYSRPRAKGRKIFGDGPDFLVPYGAIWRTGANNGTRITFADDVTVEGKSVPKGQYLIFTWPGATEWTVSLYKDVKLGGNTNDYKEADDAVKFKVKPEKLTERVETFTVNIGDISDDNKTAKVQLAWENTSVKFTVGVDFDQRVMKSIESATNISPGTYYQAASYYLENGKDLKKALEWITKAADADEKKTMYWVWHQKAKIQKALNDKQGALASANVSLAAAKADKNRDYEKMNEELIKSLK
ncbi:MAG TPA: DUF2911 domain-containing protein [Chryseosolibacter sp.]|nr:DUF2911 domain-containing protein [Chryseosolibacter sp.]